MEAITVDGNDQAVHTVTQSTYDSHNRLSNVQEINEITGTTLLDETITYDAAGNRREVSATSGATTVNAWYTYDGDNRVAVSAGSLVNGQIVVTDTAYAYAQTYDGDGNVTSQLTVNGAGDTLVQRSTYNARDQLVRADYAVDLTTGGASRGVEETRTYDADGHVLIDDQYYALGTMLGALPAHRVNPDDPDSGDSGDTGSTGTDVGGELDSATINYYDSVGRLAVAQTFGHASGWDGSDGGAAPTSAPGVDATTFGALSLQSEVVYQGAGGSAGYDADGDVVAYQYRDGSGRIDQYAVTYLRKDSYLQSTTSGENVSNTPNVRPSTDESVYDDRGNLVALTQHTQYAGGTVADTVRVFAYDGNGEIIERRDGTANGATLDQGTSSAHENQHYVYVNGQQVAHVDEGGTVDVLSEVTAFSSSTNGPNDYVVQGGDTLQSIAQAAYGDASLWYVIAQANALSSDSDLSIGQRLTIPQVTTNSNTATTVKPYDPSQVIGSTTPSLPTIAPPPPPPSHHCNALAEIVVIAVQLVATNAFGPIVGSIAGQLTGDVLGVHQGIDLGEVAVDSATQIIADALAIPTGGGSEGVAVADEAESAVSDVSTVASDLVGTSAFAQAALTAGASYVGGYAVAKIVGEPAHFSWKGLVATSLSAGITSELGPTLAQLNSGVAGGNLLQNFVSGAVQGTLTRETSLALGDHHVQSFAQIGERAAGTALGNAALGAYNNYENQQSLSALNTSVNPSLNNEINGLDASLGTAGANAANQNTINNGQLALSEAWQGFQTNNDGALAAQTQNDPAPPSNNAYASGGGDTSGSNDPSAYYVEGGGTPSIESNLYRYLVNPNDASQGGGYADDGTRQPFNPQGDSLSQLQVTNDYLSRGAALYDNGQLTDPGSFRTAGDSYVAAVNSANQNGGVYDPALVATAVNDTNTYLTNNGLVPHITDLQTVSVTGSNPDGTAAVPYTAQGIDPADLALNLPAPSVPAYTPDIQPIDLGPIPLSQPNGSGLFGTLSNAYQSLSQNYKNSEAQTDAAANRFQSLVNNAESGVDALRGNLTAYGASHGGAVGAIVANDLANKIGQAEGFSLEAIDTASGLVGLAHNVSELANPATYILDPQSNIDRLKTAASTVKTLGEVAMVANISPQFDYALVKTYAGNLYQSFQKDPSKSEGRLGFEAASVAVGGPLAEAGKVPEGVNVLENAQRAVSGLEKTAGLAPSNIITRKVGQNTVSYVLDANGNTISAKGSLFQDFGGGDRSYAEVKAQSDAAARGVAGDQGGHLVAYRFLPEQGSVADSTTKCTTVEGDIENVLRRTEV